jgi:membrane protein YqaA with SNARE-associated domain
MTGLEQNFAYINDCLYNHQLTVKRPILESVRAMGSFIQKIQRYLDRPWYPILLAGLAASDVILLFIPIDGLTVAAVLAVPKRWIQFALASSIGNILGCGILAEGVYQNSDWILTRFGPWMNSSAWHQVERFIHWSGSWSILIGAASPIPLQIWVLVPALAGMPPFKLFASLLIGRLLRSFLLCWIASHTPKLLSRSTAITKELKSLKSKLQK